MYTWGAMKKKKSTKKVLKKVKKSASTRKKAPAVSNKAGMMPLGDRVLVKPQIGETTTLSGIIIPDTAKEKPETGVVVAVGPGKKSDSGTTLPMSVKVGDKVMFSKYGFDEVKVAGVEYYLISESNILAILN
jgi:chaperonin GroES